MDPPKHTPICCIPNPTSTMSMGRHWKTAHTCIVTPHRSCFGICKFPFCLEGSTPNQHPQQPCGHSQACRVQNSLIAPSTFPAGAGQGDTLPSTWALRQHRCPFHCRLRGTYLQTCPGSKNLLLANSWLAGALQVITTVNEGQRCYMPDTTSTDSEKKRHFNHTN